MGRTMQKKEDELPSSMRSLWRIFKLAYKAEPKLLFATIGLTLFGTVPEGAMLVALAFLVHGITSGSSSMVLIAMMAVGTFVVLMWLFGVISNRINMRFSDKVTVALETHVARLQARAAGVEHHERREYLDRLAVLRNQVFALNHLFSSLFSTMTSSFRVFIVLMLLAVVHPALILLGVCAVPAIVASGKRAEIVRRTQEVYSEHNRLARHLFELGTSSSAGKELRVAGSADNLRRERSEARGRWYRPVASMRWRSAIWQVGTWSLFGISYGLSVVFVAVILEKSIAQVLIVLIAGNRLSGNLSSLVTQANFLRGDWLGAARRLAWLEDYATKYSKEARAEVPNALKKGLQFERVSFIYPGTSEYVLRDVDLFIPAGTVVALVGVNGAGKSTLIKLLCRFYEPTCGRILVDSESLAKFGVQEWRERLTGTFQDFFRFELTAQRSVGVGDLSLLDEPTAVENAVQRAGADDVVRRLPDGLQSQLGTTWREGSELSFGQWQKVAVARGLMRSDPLIRVLDEPTASLDAETEYALFERYANESRKSDHGAITVLVSHRFSTVRMADLIVVVEDSQISEYGSHDQLMASGGRYAELYEVQAGGYAYIDD